jgi:hypothetical protein
VVHGQLNLANVIQRLDGGVALLDWDEGGTGLCAIDLGYPLICEFLTEDLIWHNEQAESFFRGYRETATTPLPAVDDVVAIGLLLGLRSAHVRQPNHALEACPIRHRARVKDPTSHQLVTEADMRTPSRRTAYGRPSAAHRTRPSSISNRRSG